MNLSTEQKGYLYSVFQILIGIGFFLHGGQKIFGWFGGPGENGAVELMTIFGLAGVMELIVGALIVLGLYVSYAAIAGTLVMIGAWATVHIKQGFNPLTNGGEPALLFFAAFLALIAYGAGKWSLEKYFFKKEILH